MEGAALTGMAALLANIGSVLTAMVGWAGTVLQFFTAEGHELLLFFVIGGAAYMGVNLLRKLMRF